MGKTGTVTFTLFDKCNSDNTTAVIGGTAAVSSSSSFKTLSIKGNNSVAASGSGTTTKEVDYDCGDDLKGKHPITLEYTNSLGNSASADTNVDCGGDCGQSFTHNYMLEVGTPTSLTWKYDNTDAQPSEGWSGMISFTNSNCETLYGIIVSISNSGSADFSFSVDGSGYGTATKELKFNKDTQVTISAKPGTQNSSENPKKGVISVSSLFGEDSGTIELLQEAKKADQFVFTFGDGSDINDGSLVWEFDETESKVITISSYKTDGTTKTAVDVEVSISNNSDNHWSVNVSVPNNYVYTITFTPSKINDTNNDITRTVTFKAKGTTNSATGSVTHLHGLVLSWKLNEGVKLIAISSPTLGDKTENGSTRVRKGTSVAWTSTAKDNYSMVTGAGWSAANGSQTINSDSTISPQTAKVETYKLSWVINDGIKSIIFSSPSDLGTKENNGSTELVKGTSVAWTTKLKSNNGWSLDIGSGWTAADGAVKLNSDATVSPTATFNPTFRWEFVNPSASIGLGNNSWGESVTVYDITWSCTIRVVCNETNEVCWSTVAGGSGTPDYGGGVSGNVSQWFYDYGYPIIELYGKRYDLYSITFTGPDYYSLSHNEYTLSTGEYGKINVIIGIQMDANLNAYCMVDTSAKS